MGTPAVLAEGFARRKKGSPTLDGQEVVFRTGRYGEEMNLSLIQKSHLLADEGSYFCSTNPTPGTGISTAAAPTAAPTIAGGADNKPFLTITNKASPNDGTRIYLDYLRLRCTGPGTNGTAVNINCQLDTVAARVPTGTGLGGTVIVPTNVNMDDGTSSIAGVNVGAVTVNNSAGGGVTRGLPNIQLRPVIPVIGDIYVMSFGGAEYGVGSLISSGTGVCQQSFGHPPIVIGPQQMAIFFLWLPSQSVAGSYELDVGHWER